MLRPFSFLFYSMTISVYYDRNFYAYYGNSSNASVAAIQRILAQAEAIYAWSLFYQTIYFKKLNYYRRFPEL